MNAAMINRVVSLIPERVARTASGALLTYPDAAACRYPERIAHLLQFLHWMSPLNPITKDDQRVLGLRDANGRPVHAADLEQDESPKEIDAIELEDLEAPEDLDESEEPEQAEEALA